MLSVLILSLCLALTTFAQSSSDSVVGVCPDNTWASLGDKCIFVELNPTPSYYAAESACKYRGGNLLDDRLTDNQQINNYVSYAKAASYGESAPYVWVAVPASNDNIISNSVDIAPQCSYLSASDPSALNSTDCLKADLGYVCVADMVHLSPIIAPVEETTTPQTEETTPEVTAEAEDTTTPSSDDQETTIPEESATGELSTAPTYVREADDDDDSTEGTTTTTTDSSAVIAALFSDLFSELTNTTATNNDTDTTSPCNEGWVQKGSSCYYLVPNSPSMTWAETNAFCQAFGSHMVEINDQTEFDTVQELVQESNWTDGAWVGLYRQSIAYDMEFDDDDIEEMTLDEDYKKYLMNLPAQLGGGLCLGLSPQGDMYGYYDCSGLGNPFCQKSLRMSNETDDTADQETCPDGWILSPTGTTCYWFDGTISDLTYNNVSDLCEEKNAVIVQPITPWEDQIVRQIVQNNTWTQGPWIGIKRVPTSVSVVVPSQRSAPTDPLFAHYLNTVAMFNSNGSCAGFDLNGQTFQFWNCEDTGNAMCEIDLMWQAVMTSENSGSTSDENEDEDQDRRRK